MAWPPVEFDYDATISSQGGQAVCRADEHSGNLRHRMHPPRYR
jgi:hypothetical protein